MAKLLGVSNEFFENANCEEQESRTHLAFASFMKEQGEFTSAKNALIRAKKIFTGLNNQLGLKAVEKTQADFDIIELS